jgi:TldD protein
MVSKSPLNIEQCIDFAISNGASYADVRIVNRTIDMIRLTNIDSNELSVLNTLGYGIRVIADGCWGFCASYDFSFWRETVKKAIDIAKASAKFKKKDIILTKIPVVRDKYETPQEIDLRTISANEKIDLLTEVNSTILKVQGIQQARSMMNSIYTDTIFGSSEGSFIEQKIIACGAGSVSLAADNTNAAFRSYPASFQGDHRTAGFEHILSLDLINGSREFAHQAVQLLKAKSCKSGKKTVILDGSMMTLMIHESIGHALELDRVLGSEASYAGTSFATTEKRLKYQYGSEKVTITADSTLPGGMGTYKYDDEGSPANRTVLIENGLLKNYLTSRETAYLNQGQISGAMRAEGWQNFPLIRMTNINIEPGDSSLNQMISETEDGIFMKTIKTYSIDDKRLNFQFAPEMAWEIKNGKIGDVISNVKYSGITPEFWNSCDAVGGSDEWHLWGIPVCGKGEPGQLVPVGHGTAPARFQNIQVWGDL